MPKIVDLALPPGGTLIDVAPSNATALDIESAGADYITVDTTGSGSVTIGKLLTLEAGMAFSGATTFTIPANEENAFLVEDGSGNDYLQIDTRTGAEVLRLSADGLPGLEVHVNNSGGDNNAEVRFAGEIGFIGDPDCQIRNYGANGIEFRFVTTDVFRINVEGAFVETGKLGVGITSSLDADKLHVYSGDSGLSNYNAAAKAIVVESDDHNGMTFAAPAAKEQAIYFINSTANDRYGMVVQGSLDRMFLRSNDSYALNLQQNKVGIANTLATLRHQLQTQDGNIAICTNSANDSANRLVFEKSRNATDGEHTVVNDNDSLGLVDFAGSDSNSFALGARIMARVQGTPGDGSMPTELVFAVSDSGSETPSEAMHIRSNGNVGIGDNFPNTKLHVNANSSNSTALFYNTSTTAKGAGYSGSMAAYFENKVGPTITLNNLEHEDSNGGRETGIHFCGEKANAGEQHTLGALMVSHSGTGDDQKGQMVIHLNTGSADHSPSALHYFDGPSANVGFNYPATSGYRLTLGGNDSNPGMSIRNGSNSNGDGSRITRIDFNGKKADNNTHNLARIQAQHDGTGDDDKGKLTFSVNDGDDGDTPSLTPLQILSDGEIFINQPLSFILSSDVAGVGTPRFQIHAQGSNTTIGTKTAAKLNFKTHDTQRMSISETGLVAVGSVAALNSGEFEVNNGTQAIGFDIQGTTSAITVYGHDNNTRGQLSIGGPQGTGLLVSKYGTANITSQLGEVATWIDNQTNTNRSAFLADSNTDLILDWDVGQVGIIELVDNVDKIKFYNCPQVGRVRSFTLRIKQHASSAKTVSYSTIEFYTNKGSTAVSGTKTLQWSGGASHVMSTGVGAIDIVQFTAFSDTADTVQIYGSVIGQSFS